MCEWGKGQRAVLKKLPRGGREGIVFFGVETFFGLLSRIDIILLKSCLGKGVEMEGCGGVVCDVLCVVCGVCVCEGKGVCVVCGCLDANWTRTGRELDANWTRCFSVHALHALSAALRVRVRRGCASPVEA